MRRLIVAFAGLLLAAPAFAADEFPGRYTLGQSADGFVRLDTETGAVSHCAPQDGVWHCAPLAAESSAISKKLDALSANVTRLTAAVAALNARVAALAPVGQPAPQAFGQSVTEKIVGRFLAMVRRLKHGPDAS